MDCLRKVIVRAYKNVHTLRYWGGMPRVFAGSKGVRSPPHLPLYNARNCSHLPASDVAADQVVRVMPFCGIAPSSLSVLSIHPREYTAHAVPHRTALLPCSSSVTRSERSMSERRIWRRANRRTMPVRTRIGECLDVRPNARKKIFCCISNRSTEIVVLVQTTRAFPGVPTRLESQAPPAVSEFQRN